MADQRLGQRSTQQRQVIHQIIRSAQGPLTVPQIHDQAQRDLPRMGIATVYRTIKLLLDADQIKTVILPDGQNRYESANLKHHDHFRCRQCERVFDLDMCAVSIPNGTTLPEGFEVEDHELTLYGRCPACSNSA
jgi:Fur family ferric uptake transcriptional regulator